MKRFTLEGTITATVTPFLDGKIDTEAFEKLIERQLAARVDGVVACGITGEAPTLALAEHRPAVSLVAKLVKNKLPMIAGTAANSTPEALELVRLNEDCGADALLAIAPYCNQPSQEGLLRYFGAIAEATKLPIVLYDFPARTGVRIENATIKRLYDQHDNIIGLKDSSGDLLKAADLMTTSDIPVIAGDDTLTLPLMSIGAVGTISAVANVVPKTMKCLVDAVRESQCEVIHATHRRLYPFVRALLTLDTNPVPVKTALAMQGLCREEFRLPLCPMPEEKRAQLRRILDQFGALE